MVTKKVMNLNPREKLLEKHVKDLIESFNNKLNSNTTKISLSMKYLISVKVLYRVSINNTIDCF